MAFSLAILSSRAFLRSSVIGFFGLFDNGSPAIATTMRHCFRRLLLRGAAVTLAAQNTVVARAEGHPSDISTRVQSNYEDSIRRHSSPEKVFAVFASQQFEVMSVRRLFVSTRLTQRAFVAYLPDRASPT